MDWTAWHRLFSRGRIDYDQLTTCVLGQTLDLECTDRSLSGGGGRHPDRAAQPHHAGDDLAAPPGDRHLPSGRTAPSASCTWPGCRSSPTGYSRAVPLRFVPAFPPKAVPVPDHPPRKEWEAGVAALRWRRVALDGAGRTTQRVLALGDGAYSTASLWAALPDRVTVLAVREEPGAVCPAAGSRSRRHGPAPPLWRAAAPPRRRLGAAQRLAAGHPDRAGAADPDPVSRRRPPAGARGTRPAALPAGGQGQRSRARQAQTVARFFLVSAVADGTGLDAALARRRPAGLGLATLGTGGRPPRA
ncbi:MAG: hypothetical protein U0031_20430 [Thermomicrobiales bacterium]